MAFIPRGRNGPGRGKNPPPLIKITASPARVRWGAKMGTSPTPATPLPHSGESTFGGQEKATGSEERGKKSPGEYLFLSQILEQEMSVSYRQP